MSTKSSTSTRIPSEEESSANISQSHRRSQMTRIWGWGVDETLWNPDKCEGNMSTKSSTSTRIPSEEKSSANISQSHRRSQMTRIWEWGVDETLWNPDKTRYAGFLPPSGAFEGWSEWTKKCNIRTAEETKQQQRAIAAFREFVGESTLDLDLVDDWIDI